MAYDTITDRHDQDDPYGRDGYDHDPTTVHTAADTAERGPVPASVVDITPEAVAAIRHEFEETNTGGSRIGWFLFGFLAALVAGAVAAIVFLVVSDADDDGDLDLDVPAVQVDIGDQDDPAVDVDVDVNE